MKKSLAKMGPEELRSSVIEMLDDARGMNAAEMSQILVLLAISQTLDTMLSVIWKETNGAQIN